MCDNAFKLLLQLLTLFVHCIGILRRKRVHTDCVLKSYIELGIEAHIEVVLGDYDKVVYITASDCCSISFKADIQRRSDYSHYFIGVCHKKL